MCPEGSATLFGRFPADRPKFRPFFGKKILKKMWKIDFFRFFKNTFKSDVYIKIWLKNTFWRPKSRFPAIYHHSGQYRPLHQKSNFCKKSKFWRFFQFSMFLESDRHSAGSGRKCNFLMEMGSVDPQKTSTYHIWYFMMIRTQFKGGFLF